MKFQNIYYIPVCRISSNAVGVNTAPGVDQPSNVLLMTRYHSSKDQMEKLNHSPQCHGNLSAVTWLSLLAMHARSPYTVRVTSVHTYASYVVYGASIEVHTRCGHINYGNIARQRSSTK